MPRLATPLTDAEIRNLAPRDKPYKRFDGGGLYLQVNPDGKKFWFVKYARPNTGKDNRLALGRYPGITLAAARSLREEARQSLASGIDPGAARKARAGAAGGANSFEAVALEWLANNEPTHSPEYMRTTAGRFRNHLFPWIGRREVDAITPIELVELARRLEAKGHRETAHKIIGGAAQVFDYAVQTGRALSNPARAIKSALLPVQRKHMAAITKPEEVGRLLLDIDRYTGNFTTICALKLSPLVMLRPGELRTLKWEQVDFVREELRLPIEHMKRRQTEKEARRGELAHTVPLARQAKAILEELRQANGDSPFLFPHCRKRQDRCMSNATVLNALRSMGYDGETMSAHGFRALASTNLNELGYSEDFIERQLSHVDRNRIRAAYNHAEYLEQRRAMMQDWADWLDARREEARRREACGGLAGVYGG